MNRTETLRKAFEAWMRSTPGGGKMLDDGYLDTYGGRFWLEIFTAGADAERNATPQVEVPT